MDLKKEAKLSVLKNLKKMSSDLMGEGLKGGLSKVTVMAKDKDSLKEGLKKAEDVVEAAPEMDEEVETSESEGEDTEKMVEECDTPEEIDAMIKMLEEKKKALASKV